MSHKIWSLQGMHLRVAVATQVSKALRSRRETWRGRATVMAVVLIKGKGLVPTGQGHKWKRLRDNEQISDSLKELPLMEAGNPGERKAHPEQQPSSFFVVETQSSVGSESLIS